MDSNHSSPESLREEDINEINELASREPSFIKGYLENICNQWRSAKVTIAILGESQRGKSSFINAARGLRPGDPGAAPVRNRECTMDPTTYEYPDNQKIVLVDLPGVGTNRFQRDNYLEKIQFTRFDFLLIFSRDSFTETDTWLASELAKKDKQFFFVRTFMDYSVKQAVGDRNIQITETDEVGNLTDEMKAFMDQETEEIRAYCRTQLKVSGNENVPIYCISNKFPDRFEFSNLILDMAANLPEIQKQAFTLSTNILTEEIFRAKKNILKKDIKYYAALSGLAGVIPVPGADLIVDVPLIMKTLKFFKKQFDLDYEEDADGFFITSGSTEVCYRLIQSALNDKVISLVKEVTRIGTKAYVNDILLKWAGSEAIEQITKIASILTLGIATAAASIIGGTLSFGSTYWLLSNELSKIEKLANKAAKLRIQNMLQEEMD